ncbi:hypothetical protein GWK47_034280 [Chionoecetes opilio]|uniref:Tesmin/TSO1-like CXC domain-containing protein n=1 Tax=Chionoecetes opilio TaxID=41210 RepID=A0A8J5CP66_CHIOP|nr:hypothetical protein GWK47_034280 [Chionoecetes opilio]
MFLRQIHKMYNFVIHVILKWLKFQESRLETGENFHERLPRLNLKTFDTTKSRKTKSSSKEVILKSDNKLFRHMILVASSRKLSMKEVLKHPLGPIPWSLANTDGTPKKTNKAALARKLEAKAAPAEDIERPSACIIDGMSVVQKLKGDKLTFEELADHMLASALRIGIGSERIDVVFDVYQQLSIKGAERTSRGAETGIRFTNIIPGHKIQQWRRLLSCGASKTKLISLIASQWKKPNMREKLGGKTLYVTCDNLCFRLTRDNVIEEDELKTSQEEADTRVIFHAKHAAPLVSSIIMVAEDTDILLLCLAFHKEINCSVYVKCGTATRTRYISISKVSAALGHGVCASLLGLHSFTGCDTVSAFSGRGKLAALKLLMTHDHFRNVFAKLGKEWQLTDEILKVLEEFTCRLYVSQSEICDVNEMRYELFRVKDGNVDSGQLPPCQNCLHLHATRANYQAAIWHRALQADPEVPNPLENKGWSLGDDGELVINWMTAAPAPDTVLEFLSCKCKKSCKLPTCQCMVNGLHCTQACLLQECENMKDEEVHAEQEEGSDGSDSDSDSDTL